MLILAASALTPEQATAQSYQDLHALFVSLCIFVAIYAAAIFAEKLAHLIIPLREMGIRIKFWPTFILLCVVAGFWGAPEIHDAYDEARLLYATVRVQTIEMDGINELIASGFDYCKVAEAQGKMNEAQAEAAEAVDMNVQAAEIRRSQTIDPKCPAPTPIPL